MNPSHGLTNLLLTSNCRYLKRAVQHFSPLNTSLPLPFPRSTRLLCLNNLNMTIQSCSSLSYHLHYDAGFNFPQDQDSLAQLGLLEIVSSSSLTSILFLDKIWDMYKTPFSTIFNNNWDMHRSKTKLTNSLENFKKKFSLHSFATIGSLSHCKLQYLS